MLCVSILVKERHHPYEECHPEDDDNKADPGVEEQFKGWKSLRFQFLVNKPTGSKQFKGFLFTSPFPSSDDHLLAKMAVYPRSVLSPQL